jgi:peptide/nickel transport system permease protein
MLSNAQELIATVPMLAIWPGVLVLATVVAINFLGDGLQAAFDPRSDPR